MTDQGSAGLPSDDHPGGPLSRAERVLLSQLKRSAMHSRTLIYGMVHVLGAIPGAQKIEAAHKEAVTALDRFCLSMKTRKQGAPFPDDEPPGSAAQRPPEAVPEIERLKAENASLADRLHDYQRAVERRDEIIAAADAGIHRDLEVSKLKAENASLLESLRAAEKQRDDTAMDADNVATATRDGMRALEAQRAAAEQRAEAAEKARDIEVGERNRQWDKRKAAEQRAADLMGHLREIVPAATRDWHRQLPKLGDPEPDVGGLPEALAVSRLGAALTAARAALHDEERSEGEDGK